LPAWWAEATARFEDELYRATATVRITERGLSRLTQLGTRIAEAALANARPCEREDWVDTEVPIESIEHAARELLRLGDQGEVLAPPELRLRMSQSLREAVALYEA
jgi:hypothetical protein